MSDQRKFDEAFQRAWQSIEREYQTEIAAIAHTRRSVYKVAGIYAAVGAALIVVGGIFIAADVIPWVSATVCFLASIGFFYLSVRHFTRHRHDWKQRHSTFKVIDDFHKRLIAACMQTFYPQAAFEGFGEQKGMKEWMSRDECFNYRLATQNPSAIDGNLVDYMFASRDIGLVLQTRGWAGVSFSSDGKMSINYKDKRIAIFDARVTLLMNGSINPARGRFNTDPYDAECLDGILVATEHKTLYPFDLQFFANRERMRFANMQALEYKMASDDFNAKYTIEVSREDGVALRRALQPRMLAYLCDIGNYEQFGLFVSRPGTATSMHIKSSGLRFSLYDREMFYRSKDDVYQTAMSMTVPFLKSVGDVLGMIDCKLLP